MHELNPGQAQRKREERHVARKTSSEEFRRDPAEVHHTIPNTTLVGITADLGIMDSIPSGWVRAAGAAVDHAPDAAHHYHRHRRRRRL